MREWNLSLDAIRFFDITESVPTEEDYCNLLIDKSIDVILIKNFAPNHILSLISKEVDRYSRPHDRIKSFDIVGNTHYQITNKSKSADERFETADQFLQWMRKLTNSSSPMDSLIALLTISSSYGATTSRWSLSKCLPVGIMRVYNSSENCEILPHQDVLHWDIGQSKETYFEGQMGWNLFIDVPAEGGEVVVYKDSLDEDEYGELTGESYGLSWEKAGNAYIEIKPNIGDLMFIDTHRLHGVRDSNGSRRRITLSGFVGYNKQKPITLWA